MGKVKVFCGSDTDLNLNTGVEVTDLTRLAPWGTSSAKTVSVPVCDSYKVIINNDGNTNFWYFKNINLSNTNTITINPNYNCNTFELSVDVSPSYSTNPRIYKDRYPFSEQESLCVYR